MPGIALTIPQVATRLRGVPLYVVIDGVLARRVKGATDLFLAGATGAPLYGRAA